MWEKDIAEDYTPKMELINQINKSISRFADNARTADFSMDRHPPLSAKRRQGGKMLKRKPKSSDAGADGRNPHKGLFLTVSCPAQSNSFRPLYRRRQLPLRVWVIREYPPSTEEQAILSQLADRSGVTPAHLPPPGGEHGAAKNHPERHPPQQTQKRRQ